MTHTTDIEKFDSQITVIYYPTYAVARGFLRLIGGQSRDALFDIHRAVKANSRLESYDWGWGKPNTWIPRILKGQARALAEHIWRRSDGLINPRYLLGPWYLCYKYRLVTASEGSFISVTQRGQDFLGQSFGVIEALIDRSEGLLHLLSLVIEQGQAKRTDLLPPFEQYLRESHPNLVKKAQRAWSDRMDNLIDRGLVTRDGYHYSATQEGIAYVEHAGQHVSNGGTAQRNLSMYLAEQRYEVRQKLADTLAFMNPIDVEHLVKRLLEAMGYENVAITAPANDGGVDVVADIQLGVTTVREVVQVKRYRDNIGRPVLDQLRGSLHRFEAMRGTIISTGGYTEEAKAAAFERGAAPITLIDGNQFIDLLIEHGLGVRKRMVELIEFEPTDFQDESDD